MPISTRVSEQIGRASWIRRMFEEGLALKARVGRLPMTFAVKDVSQSRRS